MEIISKVVCIYAKDKILGNLLIFPVCSVLARRLPF
jgi:hypothetical protein